MIDLTTLKELIVGGIKLVELYINGVLVWKSGFKNWVRYSTESGGEAIYNGGLGYKNGYRIRSGGAEAASGATACTGFIPVKGGDVIRIKGWLRYQYPSAAANAINAANSSYSNIGQIGNSNYGIFASGGSAAAYNSSTIIDNANGISSWVVPPDSTGVKFIRVSAFNNAPDLNEKVGEQLIVTINEEIT